MKTKTTLPNDYERMIPEYHKGFQLYGEHIGRYKAAKDIVKGREVLDIACGSGYGTSILAETASNVIGVDISEESVKYATERYKTHNSSFVLGDGEKIPLPDKSVDVVVSFETIEHIKNYEKFVKECKRVLVDDGVLLLSTPNDLEFAEGNHFHLHEFEQSELEHLIQKYFKNIKQYYQATWISSSIGDAKHMSSEWQKDLEVVQFAPIQKDKYLYFYFICSDRIISEKILPSIVLGEHWSERAKVRKESEVLKIKDRLISKETETEQLKHQLKKIHDSITYKIYKKVRDILRLKS